MPKIPALNPLLQAWLLEGPLAAQVPAYIERLRRGRYATHTSGRCLNGLAHFAHWMSMCSLPARMLDEGCIDQFLRYHLPRCDCLGGALRTPIELHAALMPMLEVLRAQGVIARASAPTGPIADELGRYDAHMSRARGLAAGTRRGRLRIVERLLLSKFAGRTVEVSSLLPEDVRQFIVDQLQALGTTSNAIMIASTLRAYLPLAATTAAERSAANRDTPVFLAHGRHDPMVTLARGTATRDALAALGQPVEWHDYPMEHSVCAEEIADLNSWLLRVLAA